jgi:3-hydroxybutyryl-CoA dehydratase
LQERRLEDLSIGQTAERRRVVGEADIDAFAAVSGDTNPVHLDATYAAQTRFGGRIAHGMLAASWLSALLGTELPGPGAVYVSQTLRFRRPVRIGDDLVARVTVAAIDPERGRVTLDTVCLVDGKSVVEGEAVVMVERRSA